MESTNINEIGQNNTHTEGPVAKAIETKTSKIPSDAFLWAAAGAMVASAALQFTKRKQLSNFVGQWAPAILILGLYNKLVKVAGSDGAETGETEKESEGSRFDTESNRDRSSSFQAA